MKLERLSDARLARDSRRAAPSGSRRKRSRRARVLASYLDAAGRERQLIAVRGIAGSTLVVDRDGETGSDGRLIAHLGDDEPPENAMIACRCYLAADPAERRCRAVAAQDERSAPFLEPPAERGRPGAAAEWPRVEYGAVFQLLLLPSRASIPQLRWARLDGQGRQGISLREAIAAAERYEPFRGLTRAAVACHHSDPSVSTTVLRAELTRVLESPIVLNRGLREAVLARVAAGQTSMGEIAMRCGRTKRDGKGGESGETSWVARRIGLLPEGGQRTPTVWVHSDVLGLIARRGLGISPREVELG